MNLKPKSDSSLISVIITCYNHGRFLAKAIESVLSQNHVEFEIVVVDDGSTDDTKAVAESFARVKYVYQANQGLAAARNAGIEHSTGAFLVFLDADDWFLNNALATNLKFIRENPEAAFVSGGFLRVNKGRETENPTFSVTANHYRRLLEGNYIQMHATVLYRRRVFDEFRFDVSLKACEDYDLYLQIARKYPVFHHSKPVAAYYIHEDNMSNDVPMMLETILTVMDRQRKSALTAEEEKCLRRGEAYIKMIYCTALCNRLLSRFDSPARDGRAADIEALRKYHKFLYLKYVVARRIPITEVKPFIVKNAPRVVLRGLQKVGIYEKYAPPTRRINFGDFERLAPFAGDFGYSRSGPVDRYYIEDFLRRRSGKIAGRVLEIGDNEYTLKFGGERVAQSDILHVDKANPKATFFGDLTDAPQLPSDAFDCIILTQTLHLIYDYKSALQTCYRTLKPGGTLLITVPGISQIDRGEWGDNWLWSFTENAMMRLAAEIFPFENIHTETFGNVLTAAAFLYGVGLTEMKKEQLDYHDPHYQLIVAVSATKPENV